MTNPDLTDTPDDYVVDQRRLYFYQIENIIIDFYAAYLKPEGVAVYNVLTRFSRAVNDEGTRECFPGLSKIAALLGIGRSTVVASIQLLEKLVLVQVRRTTTTTAAGQRRHLPNVYTLLTPPIPLGYKNKPMSPLPPEVPPLRVVPARVPPAPLTFRSSDDFVISPDMRTWAARHTPAVDCDLASAMFAGNAVVKHKTFLDATDLLEAWRFWMRDDQRRAASHQRPNGGRGEPPGTGAYLQSIVGGGGSR